MGRRSGLLVTLIVGEIAIVVFLFQVLLDFQCSATEAEAACRLLRSLVARAIVVFAALGLIAWLYLGSFAASAYGAVRPAGPDSEAPRLGGAGVTMSLGLRRPSEGHGWMALHLAGFALLLLPIFMVSETDQSSFFQQSLIPWLLGIIFGVLGAVMWLAPLEQWRGWIADRWQTLLPVVIFFLFVPDLAELALSLWERPFVVAATFSSVSALLSLVGGAIYVDPTTRVIGYEDFYVAVAPSCSGLEGVVLMGSFVGLYGLLFRSDLQLRRYWLIVLPLALVASWIFNVIRVVSLIIIGARLSPEIAVNGFHSYAGWMFFTLTAFTLVFVLHSVPALHRKSVQSTGPRLREDQHAALILPLVVFLVSGVVGSALTIHSDLAFPARAAALAAALWFFWKWYRGLACSPDGVAALAGAAVGLLWIVTESRASQESSLHLALESLGPSLLIVWVVSRIIGAALLVPVAEELFFRGYLLARIDLGGRAGKVLAIVLSSLLFAALHERWIAATAAGIVFALIMLRRGRVGDAILAHIIANSLILLPSLVTGSWATL